MRNFLMYVMSFSAFVVCLDNLSIASNYIILCRQMAVTDQTGLPSRKPNIFCINHVVLFLKF